MTTTQMLSQTASLGGALMILGAYFSLHTNRLGAHSLGYLLLNLVGSGLLLVVAIYTGQFGFILLEAVWVLITLYGFKRLRRPGEKKTA